MTSRSGGKDFAVRLFSVQMKLHSMGLWMKMTMNAIFAVIICKTGSSWEGLLPEELGWVLCLLSLLVYFIGNLDFDLFLICYFMYVSNG